MWPPSSQALKRCTHPRLRTELSQSCKWSPYCNSVWVCVAPYLTRYSCFPTLRLPTTLQRDRTPIFSHPKTFLCSSHLGDSLCSFFLLLNSVDAHTFVLIGYKINSYHTGGRYVLDSSVASSCADQIFPFSRRIHIAWASSTSRSDVMSFTLAIWEWKSTSRDAKDNDWEPSIIVRFPHYISIRRICSTISC